MKTLDGHVPVPLGSDPEPLCRATEKRPGEGGDESVKGRRDGLDSHAGCAWGLGEWACLHVMLPFPIAW